ncbi:MAG: oxidoreductase [Rhizobiales bacterium PAR1]|nr:MAG: oxidoreductase [Rhizobiales bacterium PAR1]
MGKKLSGQVALITGAGLGIGRAIADLYAQEGAKIVVFDLKAELAETAAAAIRASGGEAIAFVGNAARKADHEAAVAEAARVFGPVTILVNNAMWNRYGPLGEVAEDAVGRMIDVGFKGVIWGLQAVLPGMKAAGGGAIINIASPSAVMAIKNAIMYCGVKAGVAGITRAAAAEFGEFNVRVNAIAPGPTATEGANRVVTEEGWERRRARTPLNRLGTVEDIAKAALFLASDDSNFITGDMIFVDGGITYAFAS